MKCKDTQKLEIKAIKVEKSFTSRLVTSYSGLTAINDYVNHLGLLSALDKAFPTIKNSATKFLNVQIFSAIVFSNLCEVHRLSHIAKFTSDCLVSKILGLSKGLDDSNIKARLLQLGQRGANTLLETNLGFVDKWARKCGLSKITIDCDSTECTVYGHQEGAEKGYNPKNKGKKSYHPSICFLTEMKMVLNTWFRAGSAYTSNGVVDFMRQTLAALPDSIKTVFFRADSGFFSGQLFDLLEEGGHEYLVKAKLTKTIKSELAGKTWLEKSAKMDVLTFDYKAVGWKKARKIYAVRILKEYVEQDFFGKIEKVPVYDYFCYCTNLKRLSPSEIHTLYGQRAESENWIEHVKNQLHAGQTTTKDFDVNDILWQLSVMAYNISVLMRYESDHNVWRQEPKTFRDWFILVSGIFVANAQTATVKMPKDYIYIKKWRGLAEKIPIAA